jgi:hypothetical protein
MTGRASTRGIVRRGRAVAALTGVMLLCFSTAAAGRAARGSAASQAPGATLPAASTTAVQAGLGVKAVPAELVFLVDVSDSMFAPGGMYSRVASDLPMYVKWLAKHEPQDRVTVVTFGRMNSAEVSFGPYPPSDYPDLVVPDTPEGSTDFGQAFSLALQQFDPLPAGAGIKDGGVILLSDGVNDPEGDPQYLDYQGQAWAALRQRAAELPVKVTGYALPLVPGVLGNQEKALEAVFGSAVRPLPNATTDLGAALQAAGQDIVDRDVASAAAPDSGKGVAVTWSGLPGPHGQLDMTKAGQLTVTVRLRARTTKVPLYLTSLRLQVPGLPVTVSWRPPAAQVLQPGAPPVPFSVRLSWQRFVSGPSFGGDSTKSGQLLLTGDVRSTYQPTLQSAFGDMAFTAGVLHGGASSQLSATTATRDLTMLLLIVAIVLFALICLVVFLTRLRGTLILTSVDGVQGRLPLGPWPRKKAGTEGLIRQPGKIFVRRGLFSPDMRIELRLTGKRAGDATIKPGGRTMVVGIDILHTSAPESAERPRAGRWT